MFSRSAYLYDRLYSWKDYRGEAARVHAIVQAKVPKARTLLDVACGTGRHLEQLRAHYDVAGLDLDPGLLEIARARLPDVPLHERNMVDFELRRTFDAVTCLFSSIGYVKTAENLRRAVAAMARHLAEPGFLVVEPWITPERWRPRHVGALFVDDEELKVARIDTSSVEDGISILDFHYLVGTPDGVDHFTERHESGLFSHDDYLDAFSDAGLAVEHDPDGLMGRGLYVALRRGS